MLEYKNRQTIYFGLNVAEILFLFIALCIIAIINIPRDFLTNNASYIQLLTLLIFFIGSIVTIISFKNSMDDRKKIQNLNYSNLSQSKILEIDKLFLMNPNLDRLYMQMYKNDPTIKDMINKHKMNKNDFKMDNKMNKIDNNILITNSYISPIKNNDIDKNIYMNNGLGLSREGIINKVVDDKEYNNIINNENSVINNNNNDIDDNNVSYAVLKAEHHASNLIFQTIADIYACENLYDQYNSREWIYTFSGWLESPILRKHWKYLRREHHPEVIKYIETYLIK